MEYVLHMLPSGWSRESLNETLRQEHTCVLLIAEGFLIYRSIDSEAEVLTIATMKEFRKRGVASRLMKQMFADLRKKAVEKIFLEVSELNTAAIKLYEGQGFNIIARRKGYYTIQGTGEDALVMEKILL